MSNEIKFEGSTAWTMAWKFSDKLRDELDILCNLAEHGMNGPCSIYLSAEAVEQYLLARGWKPAIKANHWIDPGKMPLRIISLDLALSEQSYRDSLALAQK